MDEPSDLPARPLRGRIAFGVVLLIVVGLLVLWLERRPVATHYIDRTFAARNVPARYEIADLGFGRQRLTNVVLGDPAHPDLVADWIETRTTFGWYGATVTELRGGHVRLRGTLVGGRVSLGSLDRLLPPPSGKPFALPAIDLDVTDARMRLATDYGVVGLKLAGSGRLDGGFDGRVAVASVALGQAGCGAERVEGVLRIRSTRAGLIAASGTTGSVRMDGPVRLGAVSCGGVRTGAVRSEVGGQIALGGRSSWSLETKLAVTDMRHRAVSARSIAGTVSLHGGSAKIVGPVRLTAAGVRGFGASAGRVVVDGSVAHDLAPDGVKFGYLGKVAVAGADASALLPRTELATSLAGTPLAPLAMAGERALRVAARRFAGEAEVNVSTARALEYADVSRAVLSSASGARVAFGDGVGVAWKSTTGLLIDGTVSTIGGGLPQVSARLVSKGRTDRLHGVVTVARYAAGDAAIALTPVSFATAEGGAMRIATTATLSGPIGGGRVEGLTLPIVAIRDGGGHVIIDPTCAPVGFDRLAVSGLVIDRSRVTLCPVDGALLRVDVGRIGGGRIGGGARLGAVRLGGKLSGTPVTLTTTGAMLRLADRRFAVEGARVRLGSPDRETRLDIARLDGSVGGSIGGTFLGSAGQIGRVPLLLSNAAGRWGIANGALTLDGTMMVADAATDARFRPLAVRGVALRLARGRIDASGALFEPTVGRKVADVRLVHNLSAGRGSADFSVATLAFDKDFQPDRLTRLTFGVIADVRGTIAGDGHIAWSPDGVTSTGAFRTAGTDLAAAFGPVTGIAGEIRFTDLLALQSGPGQVATVRTINPGIPVENGTIRYQTLPNARVRVEGGRWPFAGGALMLDRTLLDFSQPAERRMTFRVEAMAADQFLQQFDFKNLDATGLFDGVIPMVFDTGGGRIEGGSLVVRTGGGTIAYVGEVSQKNVGLWGNLAFQALKSLRYRNLSIGLNGPLAGEMITDVHFAGVSQGQGAKSNFLIRRLQRLPFVFNIRIRAPFRGLLDSAQSFYDPKRLVQRNLQSLLDVQNRRVQTTPPAPIQPPASRTVP